MLDSHSIAIAIVAFLLAGFVKGVLGLGLPTVAIGILGLVMRPADAVVLLTVPTVVTNVWQLAAGPAFSKLMRRLWPMMIAVCVGIFAGSGLLVADTRGRATTALGVALVIYAGLGLTTVRFSVPPRAEVWLGPLAGATTGLVSAATGVFSIPGVPYLQALQLEKNDLVQALGLLFTVGMVALAAMLMFEGAWTSSVAGASVVALAPAAGGMLLGARLRERISAQAFRTCFFLGLLVLGTHLALRTLY
jgi:uncharacterized protein